MSRRRVDDRAVGIGCALLMVAVFAGFNIVSRLGSETSMTAWDLGFLRFTVGGLIMLPIFVRKGLAGLSFGHAALIALLGGLGFALSAYAGFTLAPASHGGVLLHGTLPLFTFLVGLCFGYSIRRRAVPGLLLILLGSALMVYDTVGAPNPVQIAGDAWFLLAALFWSTCGILISRAGLHSTAAAPIVVVLSACVYVPSYLLLGDLDELMSADPRDLATQAGFQGVIVGAFSIFIYARAVESLGPNGTAIFSATIPGVTSLAAIPLLGERPGDLGWWGIAVVTVGMLATFLVRFVGRQ
ncbi:Protein of unknown function DUF6 [Salipiger mucosus DSM 16094]|uniref:EamA domain-containing protein n=1 Tax=Salipiger mucosus DSM 16094 TaxID=1123237 RepID=S9RE33_9RHOB|nr:Protein of unknown function DUF6 [Salipiger mucosus DSM 16094]